ncbi:MAG: hypothetical protein GF313_07155 [Caldithrix sp.]|nr:hypothetical protein [Caldithrix sp.]
MLEILLLSSIGAILSLDTTAAFQVMVSQPVVACALIGWFGGDIVLGLHIGFLLQLLWLSNLPVGAALVPEGNVGSMIAAIVALRLDSQFPSAESIIILAALLSALVASYFGRKMVKVMRDLNVRLFDRMLNRLKNGNIAAISQTKLLVIGQQIVIAVFFVFLLSSVMANFFKFLLLNMPPHWDQFAQYVEVAVLGSGIGLTLTLYHAKKNVIWLVPGFILGLLIWIL